MAPAVANLLNGERQVAPELSGIRRDHVARYEFAARKLPNGSRAIDLACGVGYGAYILAEAGCHVVAIDRSEEAIHYARQHYAHERIEFICADATEWAAQAIEQFDAAVCFETIEHIEDPLPLLKALRELAPQLIASVPNESVFPHEGKIKFHFRHYTRPQFSSLLRRAGYAVDTWHGQEGRESEVADNLEGRTLIAAAKRSNVVLLDPIPSATVNLPVPEHVAIVGLGPSGMQFFELVRGLGGKSAFCDEVWGINAIGDTFRCDRIFHMDDLRVQEARAAAKPGSNIAAMVKWLKTHPGPVYTSVVREGYPGLVAFPLEEVLNRRLDQNGGAPYFNSTAAYAIAFAIHIGVKRISLFGLDYTYPNRHHAERGRACCEFWLGIAAARGIEITVPESTSLLDGCEPEQTRLYGYDCVDVFLRNQEDGSVKVEMTERLEIPSAEAVEKAYDHSVHPNPLLRGKA